MSWKPHFSVLILLVTAALTPLSADAEYRVYLLRIGEYGTPSPYRSVESTLAPRQYTEYHRLNPNEVIDYVDTWMCWGRGTARTPLCPSPRNAAEILAVAPPIGQGFHPWAPQPITLPDQLQGDPGITTRTPATEAPPEPEE